MKYTLLKDSIEDYNESESITFPKYTTQLMNLANSNAHGTRPVVVGNMSELFPEFENSGEEMTIEAWRKCYTKRYPDAFEKATNKIYSQIQNLRDAISLIDSEMVQQWVEDLIINKTFNGFYVQKAILASLAEIKGKTYRMASPSEESIGIDGFIGDVPYSVKPDTYKTMDSLPETINVKFIYYTKTKLGLNIEVED